MKSNKPAFKHDYDDSSEEIIPSFQQEGIGQMSKCLETKDGRKKRKAATTRKSHQQHYSKKSSSLTDQSTPSVFESCFVSKSDSTSNLSSPFVLSFDNKSLSSPHSSVECAERISYDEFPSLSMCKKNSSLGSNDQNPIILSSDDEDDSVGDKKPCATAVNEKRDNGVICLLSSDSEDDF